MILVLTVVACAYLVHLYRYKGWSVSPDGRFYLRAAAGERVPLPYSRRWLLPLLLRTRARAWQAVSVLSWLALGPLVYLLTGSVMSVWLLAWLPGLALNVKYPILTDLPAMALALGGAVAAHAGHVWLACVLLLVSGQVKETAPIFGALLCLSAWTVGAAAVSVTVACCVGHSRAGEHLGVSWLEQPWSTALQRHDPLSWVSMALPWGAVALLAVGYGATVHALTPAVGVALVSVAVGYAQLLIAQDEARLYQWAAPAVLVTLVGYEPGWLPYAAAAHPFLCGAARGA